MSNERVLTVALFALAVYFSVLVARALGRYLLFRRVRRTAVLTWPARRPPHLVFLLGLGVLSAALAVIHGVLDRPFHHVYSQAVMALYFIFFVPLLARIPLGFYEEGVWADTGFLPYAKIGRLAFRESPEIVLILMPRGSRRAAFHLPVPPEDYGAARKVLEEKIRARALKVDEAILGL